MPAFDRKTHPREYLFQRCKELIDKINTASNDMVIMPLVKSVVDTRNSRNQITGYILNIRSGFGPKDFPKLSIWIDTGMGHVCGNIGPCDTGIVAGTVYFFDRPYNNKTIFRDIPRSLALMEAGHAG